MREFIINNYINIFCLFNIILSILLGYTFFTKKRNNIDDSNIKKILILFFINFCLFSFCLVMDKSDDTSYNNNKYFYSYIKKVKFYGDNKVIIVGDSRMSLIASNNNLDIPNSFNFISKSGASYEWFENEALKSIKETLDNSKDDIHYHVVLNMGVNDLTFGNAGVLVFEKYYDAYEKLASEYENVNFYILSINPVIDNLIEKKWHGNNNVSYMIKKYNSILKNRVNKSTLENIYFCDSYNNIEFKTLDGLHYSTETNKKIINYISNKCVIYK